MYNPKTNQMSNRKDAPEVNAGSMADIAFLLLIFFLVTTVIETDAGLNRMLPPIDVSTPPDIISEKNILRISLNGEEELLVEDEIVGLNNLKNLATAFLDNGGAPLGDGLYCDYCLGERNPYSSDNPVKAVISVTSHRQANYGTYIAVQNELVGAYNTLRNREAQRLFGESFNELEAQYSNPTTSRTKRQSLKDKIISIQDLFPMKLIEAEIK